ncbi:hypothetical protein D3C72_2507630 [compost metagenome]
MQGSGVQGQGFFQILLGILDLAKGAKPTLGPGPTAGDDPGPEPGFRQRWTVMGKR